MSDTLFNKEDFEKTFGMDFNTSTQKTVNGYVDSLINKANEIKKTSDAVNSTFQNPFKNYIDPTPEQEKENFNYDTFESWKTDCIYYRDTPENRQIVHNYFEEREMLFKQLI